MELGITVRFDKGYIADPYWPEMEKIINIQKASGFNRIRSEERRVKALEDYLQTIGMSMDEYRELEKLARRPFYRQDGPGKDGATPAIIIPAHQVYGAFAQASAICSSSLRIARQEQIRTILVTSDWLTEKTEEDGIWDRFVVVKSGSGKQLTNQRALRSNAYIEKFEARGTLHCLLGKDHLKKLGDFLRWVGAEVGIGASRKLGWGRFEVSELILVDGG